MGSGSFLGGGGRQSQQRIRDGDRVTGIQFYINKKSVGEVT